MVKITKYSTPGCMNCRILGMKLKPIIGNRSDVEYSEVDITRGGCPDSIQAVPHLTVEKDGNILMDKHVDNVIQAVKFIESIL